jgi:hypothetical protein
MLLQFHCCNPELLETVVLAKGFLYAKGMNRNCLTRKEFLCYAHLKIRILPLGVIIKISEIEFITSLSSLLVTKGSLQVAIFH